MKESISSIIHGKRINNTVKMTGIGDSSVYSTVQILAMVQIDDIALEILFHVLPDKYLRHNIMIGYDVLAQGVDIFISSNKLHFTKTLTVNACATSTTAVVDFTDVDTDVPSICVDSIIQV